MFANLICIVLVAVAALTACSPASDTAKPAAAAIATALPTDQRLAGLYQASCKNCHGVPNTGAPLTGDESQWATRWDKGLPALLQSTIVGLNGMPPGGQCFACNSADYESLIRFMANRAL
jgi:cytochrome c5